VQAEVHRYAEQFIRPPGPEGMGFGHFMLRRRAGYRDCEPENKAFEVVCHCCSKAFVSGGTLKTGYKHGSLANFITHVRTAKHMAMQQKCQSCNGAGGAAPQPPAAGPAAANSEPRPAAGKHGKHLAKDYSGARRRAQHVVQLELVLRVCTTHCNTASYVVARVLLTRIATTPVKQL
jgi:hypothetical protein